MCGCEDLADATQELASALKAPPGTSFGRVSGLGCPLGKTLVDLRQFDENLM